MQFPQREFVKASPESQGVQSSVLSAVIDKIASSGKDIHSMLVVKNGVLISETYFAPYTAKTKHSLFSCSKTFTSMLIGIAQGKGLLQLSDTVVSFFPDKVPENPDAHLLSMRIQDLLCMASGNAEDTFPYMTKDNGDWVRVFFSRPVEYAPGTHFCYNTGATFMLSAILTAVTGKTALQLANEWIFDKIGIRFAKWDSSPQGLSLGGTGLHLTPLQMARFGLLLLNEGNWEGEQIIPQEYVRLAREKKIHTEKHISHPDWCAGYCYQMWRCSFNAYRADGMGGQFITILPEQDAVVVFTSALGSDIVYPMDIVGSDLFEALRGTSEIPENPSAFAELTALSASVEQPAQGNLPEEARNSVPWGKKISPNEKLMRFIHSITLYDRRIQLDTDMGSAAFPFSWNAPALDYADISLPFLRNPVQLSFMGKWEEESSCLLIRVGALGEPWTVYLRIRFAGDSATISLTSTMAADQEYTATVG